MHSDLHASLPSHHLFAWCKCSISIAEHHLQACIAATSNLHLGSAGPVQVPAEQKELAKAVASQQIMAIKRDYQSEASISASLVEANQGQTPRAVLTQDAQQRLLKLLQQLPHGAIKYSEAVPGVHLRFLGASVQPLVLDISWQKRSRLL